MVEAKLTRTTAVQNPNSQPKARDKGTDPGIESPVTAAYSEKRGSEGDYGMRLIKLSQLGFSGSQRFECQRAAKRINQAGNHRRDECESCQARNQGIHACWRVCSSDSAGRPRNRWMVLVEGSCPGIGKENMLQRITHPPRRRESRAILSHAKDYGNLTRSRKDASGREIGSTKIWPPSYAPLPLTYY